MQKLTNQIIELYQQGFQDILKKELTKQLIVFYLLKNLTTQISLQNFQSISKKMGGLLLNIQMMLYLLRRKDLSDFLKPTFIFHFINQLIQRMFLLRWFV